ncbi:MAG: outer membrane protein transport protein [Acidobacteriota bacterium]
MQKMRKQTKVFALCIPFLALFFITNSVWASALSKPSPVDARAIAMGGAFVAVADDPLAIYWNPAGLTQLEGMHLTFGFDSTIPSLTYHPYTIEDQSGVATRDEKAKRDFLPAPTFGFSTDRLEPVVLGIGLYLPYANGGKFEGPSQAVGNPLDGLIYSMELSPALAFRVHEMFSIGISLRASYTKSELNGQFIPPLPEYGPFGGNVANIETAGWGYGWATGVLLNPHRKWRFGMLYKSKIESDLSGDFILDDLSGNRLAVDDAELRVIFPAQARLGFAFDATENLLLAFSVDWEENSSIENYEVTFARLTGSAFQIPARYEDNYTFHLGSRYRFNDRWTGAAGYAYDESAIPDSTTNRIMGDLNAHEITFGASYSFSGYSPFDSSRSGNSSSAPASTSYSSGRSSWSIDIAYDMRFGERTVPVLDSSGSPNAAPGKYKGLVQSLSFMLRKSF